MVSFLWVIFGGVIGSVATAFATAFVVRPLFSEFLGLRSEVAAILVRYERDAVHVQALLDSPTDEFLSERKDTYEACGSRLVAFAAANSTLTKLLHMLGFYTRTAGDELLTLSESPSDLDASFALKSNIMRALKL